MSQLSAGRLAINLGKQRVCLFKRCYAVGNAEVPINEVPKNWQDAKSFDSIPGPKPLPLIGNAWRFLAGVDFLKIMEQMHKYGDVVKMRELLALGDMTILFNIKDIEWMLRNEGVWPIRDGLVSIYKYRHVLRKDIFGDTHGLLNGQHEKWGTFRTAVNPIMMQPRTTHQYVPQINTIADEFIEKIKKFKSQDANSEMPKYFIDELNRWAFESIHALDTRLGVLAEKPSERAEKAMHCMLEILDLTFALDFMPGGKLHMKFGTSVWKKFVRNQDFFTDMCLELIEEAQQKINNDSNYAQKQQHEKSVFERLVSKDKKVAMVMILDMMSAGIDTTAKATAGTLYFLSKSQSSQAALRSELQRLLPSKNTPITKDVLDEAKYLKAAIKEALRIAPIGIGNMRKTTKPMVIGGYQIPEGTLISMPNLYLSKVIDTFYTNPEEYIPERWLRDVKTDNVNAFVSLPFGFGARSCIGKRMASMEIEVLVAKIVRNFALGWHYPDMTFKQGLVYGVADPLRIRMTDLTN